MDSYVKMGRKVQMTLVICAFVIRGFILVSMGASISCLRPSFRHSCLRRTVSRLMRRCETNNTLSVREFCCQFNNVMATVIPFSVLRVSDMRGHSQERSLPCGT